MRVARGAALILLVVLSAACGGTTADGNGAGCVADPVARSACVPGVPACPAARPCEPSWTCDPTTHEWDEAIPNCVIEPPASPRADGGSASDACGE